MRPALVSFKFKCVTLGFKGHYVVAHEMAQDNTCSLLCAYQP